MPIPFTTKRHQAKEHDRAHRHTALCYRVCLYYRENIIQFALKSREIPLTSSKIASEPKCVLWKGANLLTTKHGPAAVSLLHQNKRQSYRLNSCQKGKASTKDRGFATLTHPDSVFNVTTAIPEEGQYASPNPQRPPRTRRDSSQHGSLRGEWEPNSALCPAMLCSKHSTRPDTKKSTWSPKTWSDRPA